MLPITIKMAALIATCGIKTLVNGFLQFSQLSKQQIEPLSAFAIYFANFEISLGIFENLKWLISKAKWQKYSCVCV